MGPRWEPISMLRQRTLLPWEGGREGKIPPGRGSLKEGTPLPPSPHRPRRANELVPTFRPSVRSVVKTMLEIDIHMQAPYMFMHRPAQPSETSNVSARPRGPSPKKIHLSFHSNPPVTSKLSFHMMHSFRGRHSGICHAMYVCTQSTVLPCLPPCSHKIIRVVFAFCATLSQTFVLRRLRRCTIAIHNRSDR